MCGGAAEIGRNRERQPREGLPTKGEEFGDETNDVVPVDLVVNCCHIHTTGAHTELTRQTLLLFLFFFFLKLFSSTVSLSLSSPTLSFSHPLRTPARQAPCRTRCVDRRVVCCVVCCVSARVAPRGIPCCHSGRHSARGHENDLPIDQPQQDKQTCPSSFLVLLMSASMLSL